MFAAAQAAAEAALREAEARDVDRNKQAYADANGMANVFQQQQQQEQDVLQQQMFQQQQQQQQQQPPLVQQQSHQQQEELMLDLFYQQEQQQQQQQHHLATNSSSMSVEPILHQSSRPREHYMTITNDGTIVEATDTVIGFPPEALLMTSTYDTLFDEDLPGFLCVKSQFWDKKQLDVEVFIRRRNLDGEWVWLCSKAVQWVEQHPIQGVVLHETVVEDERAAKFVNRAIRITATVAQAAEAARLTQNNPSENEDGDESSQQQDQASLKRAESGTLLNETAEMEALLRRLQENGMIGGSGNTDFNQLLEIATTRGKGDQNGNHDQGDGKNEKNSANKKGFDPYGMIEEIRKGIRLDLGLTALQPEEVRLLTMVLTGELEADAVAPLVLQSLQSNYSLSDLLQWRRQQLQEKQQRHMQQQNEQVRHQNHQTMMMSSFSRGVDPRMRMISTIPSRSTTPPPSPFNDPPSLSPPPIAVVNLSCTYIGNVGVEILGEALFTSRTALKTVDISFCGIDEKGFLALAKAIAKRKKKSLDPIRGLILSGNHVTPQAASALGAALAVSLDKAANARARRKRRKPRSAGGYESDSSDEDEFDDDDDEPSSSRRRRGSKKDNQSSDRPPCCDPKCGIQVLHLASTSLKADALGRLLEGLGPHASLRELNLSSNHFRAVGASVLSRCLEGPGSGGTRQSSSKEKTHVPLPYLDRIDISNNSLGDDGATQLTKIISNRSKVDLIDLRLSSNSISSAGIEKIMNKLLHHNLISLALDKNAIGDQGCQLVAASLQSMKSLGRLNLNFNQIGSRGINSLMRSLIACESVTFLGLSGNILKISGAMALAFTLAQHPRLEELHLDNCCLGQAAQCHIVAGIISNRWVPMKRLAGYAVGPPMVAIGALKPYAQNLSNEECFRIRKDEQMKTILQWMESHRGSGRNGSMDPSVISALGSDSSDQRFLTPEFVSSINDVHGIPSQNAYFRMLGWLSSIPFDDDELTVLQKYFYDVDGGDGDRGSDGYINLKLRGDLLAALDSEIAEEIRDVMPALGEALKGSVGIDLDKIFRKMRGSPDAETITWKTELTACVFDEENISSMTDSLNQAERSGSVARPPMETIPELNSEQNGADTDAAQTNAPSTNKEKKVVRAKPRITMFPKFEQQLEQLKSAAAEMIEQEEDPMHHEVILTQYAEASLTILRQLRYHCMNSGLDGWRQGGLKRKVLVVDDSRITRRLVSKAFEDANFIVDTAANGAEGVDKMKASIYDIAFMDIDMPVMNGFEATKKLREWEDKSRPGARQPICALTAAYVDDFERSELMKFKEAGLDVMESKPCNIPRLLKVVDDVSPMFSNLRLDVTQQERSNGRSDHSS